MPDVCFGFEVHQPFRIFRDFNKELSRGKKTEELFEIYFDNEWNKEILKRVAKKCYVPANEIILRNIDNYKREKRNFKIAYSISGVLVEQLDRWAPEALDLFKQLADSGCVEFLDQTYYHSISSLFSSKRAEFIEQVNQHRNLMKEVFDYAPRVFENTEFIYNNSIAKTLHDMGYQGVFTEGAGRILGWRSPNYIYKSEPANIAVILRNNRLSDDVAFRFSARDWIGWPLTADKYAAWLSATPGQCINIFVDYETFGEHQWPETGILEFLKWLPEEILKYDNLQFKTPFELVSSHTPVGVVSVNDFDSVSWADVERSTNAWLGNDMQRTCYNALRNLEPYVKKSRNEKILKLWRLLQTSDHLYYMYTEPGASGMVHGYFSNQPPVQAFWAYTRILSDFHAKVAENLDGLQRTSACVLRIVPPDEAFHFHENGRYVNLSAHSLDEFRDALLIASDRSVEYHIRRGDFQRWVSEAIEDAQLAHTIGKIRSANAAEIRKTLYDRVTERISELRGGTQKAS